MRKQEITWWTIAEKKPEPYHFYTIAIRFYQRYGVQPDEDDDWIRHDNMQYVPVDNLRGQKEGFYSQDDSIYEPLDNVFEYFDDAVLYPPKELLGNHISGPTFDEVMGAAKAVAKCYPEEEKETVFVVFYKHPDEEYVFQKIFYTEEKASKYCARMNGNIGLLGMFVFKEEEIE